MKRLLALALALAIAPGAAAPRAQSAGDCAVFADLALNAAAHAKHGIARETFDAIAADIYDIRSEDGREFAARVIDAAWRAAKAGVVPGDFASVLMRVCRMQAGNMDSILGTSL